MQNNNIDIFFSLLRSSIWQKWRNSGSQDLGISGGAALGSPEIQKSRIPEIPNIVPDGYDWTELIQMFKEQALLGVVASTIMQLPKEKSPQTLQLQDALLSSYAMHIKTRDKILRTIVTVFDMLEKNGIKPILMKGESMVRFYPLTCQRGIGDIDVLVPQDKYRQAVKILQEVSGDMGHEDSMERHYKIQYNGFDLEIHQRPIWCANSTHKKDFQKLSQKYIDPDKAEMIMLHGKDIRVFPMQYNVLFIFNHFLEHLRDGGIGFKQIIDFTLMLDSIGKSELRNLENKEIRKSGTPGTLNLSILEQELKQSGLLRAWKVMGGIAVKQLGLPKEAFPFYDETLAQKSQGEILRRIIDGGLFGWKLHLQGNTTSFAPLRILKNIIYVIKDTRYLWTLFPSGALSSSWGIIKGSLRNHAGIVKGNTIFDD